jgi:hypothetical protein
MDSKKPKTETNDKLLTDKEFFETLQIAKSQYETYIQLTTYNLEDKSDYPYNTIKRDINHPLNIVIK